MQTKMASALPYSICNIKEKFPKYTIFHNIRPSGVIYIRMGALIKVSKQNNDLKKKKKKVIRNCKKIKNKIIQKQNYINRNFANAILKKMDDLYEFPLKFIK